MDERRFSHKIRVEVRQIMTRGCAKNPEGLREEVWKTTKTTQNLLQERQRTTKTEKEKNCKEIVSTGFVLKKISAFVENGDRTVWRTPYQNVTPTENRGVMKCRGLFDNQGIMLQGFIHYCIDRLQPWKIRVPLHH